MPPVARSRSLAFLLGAGFGVSILFPVAADPNALARLFPDAVIGDFDGDGETDALLRPTGADLPGAQYQGRAAGQDPRWVQDIPAGFLGLDWQATDGAAHSGDFDGDRRDDVYLQPYASGRGHSLVLTDAAGYVGGIAQRFPANLLGLDWSATASAITVGDYDGDGLSDAFLQSRHADGQQAVVLTVRDLGFAVGVQSFADGYLSRHWSADAVRVHQGDFDGDGRGDLLLQVRDDLLLGAPYHEAAYAVLLAGSDGRFTAIHASWERDELGLDWSPEAYDLVLQDVDGDGRVDLALIAKAPNGTHSLLLGDGSGRFSGIAARWRGNATPQQAFREVMRDFDRAVHGTTGDLHLDDATAGTSLTSRSTASSQRSFASGYAAVGAVQGSAGVSGGAASYSLPIVVPPGRAGMQPQVSVGYSSRGGNGALGMGFGLGVGSSISRCAQTIAQDGKTIGITYSDSTDRLCLDGQRLKVATGTYGSNGAVYRTELESYVRVEQSGALSSSGSKFTVKHADGRVSYYGHDTGSRFTAVDAPAPLSWLLTRVEDPAGNSLIYGYDRTVAGEALVSEVAYTGRGTNPGDRKVQFLWETRPDQSVSYLWGGKSVDTRRLYQIDTKVGAATVREYRFQYTTVPSAASGRSLLDYVEECAYAAGVRHCLPPTRFSWQQPVQAFQAIPSKLAIDGAPTPDPVKRETTASSSADEYRVRMGSAFLGQGKRDHWVQIIDRDFTAGPVTAVTETLRTIIEVDAVGAVPPAVVETTPVVLPPNASVPDLPSDQSGKRDYQWDADRDGATDIVDAYQGKILDVKDGVSRTISIDPSTAVYRQGVVHAADFDGDGKLDLLNDGVPTSGGSDGRAYIARMVPNQDLAALTYGFTAWAPIGDLPDWTVPPPHTGVVPGRIGAVRDFDGDGRLDFTYELDGFVSGSSIAKFEQGVFLNRSTPGNFNFVQTSFATLGIQGVVKGFHQWADLNGDGLDDLLWINTNGHWWIMVNRGGSFSAIDTGSTFGLGGCLSGPCNDPGDPSPRSPLRAEHHRVGDLDNDGRMELLVPTTYVAEVCSRHIMVPDSEPDEDGGIQWVLTVDPICGDSLYFNNAGALNESSVFRFAALRFDVHPGGTATASDRTTAIIGNGSSMQVGDVDGDGLSDVLWTTVRKFKHSWLEDREPGVSGWFQTEGVYVEFDTAAAPDLLIGVTDGLQRQAQWDYAPLSDDITSTTAYHGTGQGHYKSASAAAPTGSLFDFTSSMYTVTEFRQSHHGDATDCVGTDCATWRTLRYAYEDAKYDGDGRGFAGFERIVEEDQQRGLQTITEYHQAFPKTGQVARSVTRSTAASTPDPWSGSAFLSRTVNTWTAIAPIDAVTQLAVLSGAASTSQDPEGNALGSSTSSTVATSSTMGCPASSVTTTSDAFGSTTVTTTNVWTPDVGASWWPCRLDSTKQDRSVSFGARHGVGAVTTTSSLLTSTTYNARRQPATETVGPWPANAALTRTTAYGYVETPGSAAYGNLQSTTLTGGSGATAITSRTTTTGWSADGHFVGSVINALGHTTTSTTDAAHGQPTQVTDPNGVDTYFSYDAFGRKSAAWVEDLPAQAIAYADCVACDGVASARYMVTTTQAGQSTQVVYFDALNRAILSAVDGFSTGQKVLRDTAFDHLGRTRSVSEPYYAGQTRYAAVTTGFDALDRAVDQVDAKGLALHYDYAGLITTVTATGFVSGVATTQTTTQEKTSAGQLLTTIDGLGGMTHFRYDALGNPTLIKDAIGATVTTQYNALGQKTVLDDPDLGHWTYAYDVLGELLTQTDARGKVSTFSYDLLGRMKTRVEPEGAGPCTTTWSYDPVNGLGKPQSVVQGCDNYREDYAYDTKGRVITQRTTADGGIYEISTTYDAFGRIDTIAYPETTGIASGAPGAPTNVRTALGGGSSTSTNLKWDPPLTGGAPTAYRAFERYEGAPWGGYTQVSASTFSKLYTGLGAGTHEFKVEACNASGCTPSLVVQKVIEAVGGEQPQGGSVSTMSLTSSYGSRFAVRQVYSASGYLSQVQDANGGGPIWTATALSAYGAVSGETAGNGLITSRAFEAGTPFVTSVQTSGGAQALSYAWSDFGHLTQRTDTAQGYSEAFSYDLLNRVRSNGLTVGGVTSTTLDVTYDATGNLLTKQGVGTYSYPAVGAGLNHPHAVTGIAGTTSQSFSYDANGNMTSRNGGSITWNTANLPVSIASGSYSATFKYGASRARYQQVATYSGRTETTYYVGGLYEKFSRTDRSGTEHVYHVTAGGLPVAKVTDSTQGSGARTIRYLHRDHLGSIDTVTNEAGAIVARMSFDAHGQRRVASGAGAWSTVLTYLANTAAIDTLRDSTRRGFTDHEMLDSVGLIHANGRVYDPALGRFLSVDPVFQFPTNTQSLNPYTYVLNSPLSLTDPTGLCSVDDTEQACADSLKEGETQNITNEKGGVVGTVGKDKDGNLYVTNGEGQAGHSGIKAAMSGDPDKIGGIDLRGKGEWGSGGSPAVGGAPTGTTPQAAGPTDPQLPAGLEPVLREGGEAAQTEADRTGTEACHNVCQKLPSNPDPNAPEWARGGVVSSKSEISCRAAGTAAACPSGYKAIGVNHVHEGPNGDGRASITKSDLPGITDSNERALTAMMLARSPNGRVAVDHDAYRMSGQDHSVQDVRGFKVFLYTPNDQVIYRASGTDYAIPAPVPACQIPAC